MTGEITLPNHQHLIGRNMLFCIKGKCMTGHIFLCEPTGNDNRYHIKVDFIEPLYFEDLLAVGEYFTIQEGNIVLITGTVVSTSNE